MDITLLIETIFVFAAILGVLVVVHEWGHFTMARLTGMKVHEFAFGFGPILARLGKKKGTDFNIRAIPLGGFVRIAGMDPGESEDVEGGFNTKRIANRAFVILAGPVMSLVLGYVVFLLIGFVWGFPTDNISTRIGQVTQKSIAEKVGLRTGDTVVAIDGRAVSDGRKMVEIIHASANKTLTLSVSRQGKQLIVKATPTLVKNEFWDEATPEQRAKYKMTKFEGRLGFMPLPETERVGFFQSIARGTKQTLNMVTGIVTTIFSRNVGKNVGGIVMIGYQTSEMVKLGWQWVFTELAALSVMLGILNLIPWPMLDGGHVLYLVIEKLRGGKRMAPEIWATVQMAGFAVIAFLAIFLVYFDIFRIWHHSVPQ